MCWFVSVMAVLPGLVSFCWHLFGLDRIRSPPPPRQPVGVPVVGEIKDVIVLEVILRGQGKQNQPSSREASIALVNYNL